MSQHVFASEYQGKPISILMGWDRPLQGFFMVIEVDGADEYIYTNLDDPTLAPFHGLPDSIDHFVEKLGELGLALPARMVQEIQNDSLANVGNRYVTYEQDGTVRV